MSALRDAAGTHGEASGTSAAASGGWCPGFSYYLRYDVADGVHLATGGRVE